MGIYILEAKRSAIGKFHGKLENVSCLDLSTQVINQMVENIELKKSDINEVIVGNVLSANQGQNIARQIIINCKIPIECCGYSINMVCGSGMKAIANGYLSIKANHAKCIIAGGVENMSNSPYLLLANDLERLETIKKEDLISHLIKDSLSDAILGIHMGETAENIANKYKISREEQDWYAYNSHKKAVEATQKGVFNNEIVPIHINGDEFVIDEHIRYDINIEKMNALRTIFSKNGSVTAGNSSGINDGACFLIISNEELINQGFKAKAEIIDFAQIGNQPELMGMGAYLAIKKLIEKNSIEFSDIDLFEINEAFAVQTIAVINELAKDYNYNKEKLQEKVNISGGAIALGHPIGASGARIITTLITNLKERKLKYGIASLCVGGGMGIAMLIKNID